MKTNSFIKRYATGLFITVFLASFATPTLYAAPSVSITSPSSGQAISDNSKTITGTASPNRTVIVSVDGQIIGTVVANTSGDWMIEAHSLVEGNHSVSAKVLDKDYYAYFGATNGTNTINRLRSSDDGLNTGSGWPIVTTDLQFLSAGPRSPQKDKMYWLQVGAPSAAPGLFDLSAPADPVPVTGYTSVPNPDVYTGTFNVEGTKYYSPNNGASTVSVVDVATNTQTASISVGGIPQVATLGSNGKIYVSPAGGNKVAIINPSSNTIIKTVPLSCPTANSLGAAQFVEGRDYYLVSCALDGIVYKLKVDTDSIIATWDMSAVMPTLSTIVSYPGFSKGYGFGTYGNPNGNRVAVIDLANGTVLSTFNLTADTFSGVLAPDGQYIYASTPGAFNTTNIDKISTVSDSVVDSIDTSSVGVPGNVTYGAVESTITTVSFVVGQSDSSQLAATGHSVPYIAVLFVLAISLFLLYWGSINRST